MLQKIWKYQKKIVFLQCYLYVYINNFENRMKKLLLTALILFSVIASGNDVVMPQEHKLELGRFDTIANGQDTLVIYHVLPLPMHLRELIINIHEIEDTF